MMPTQIVSRAVAMAADAGAQPLYFRNQVYSRQLFKIPFLTRLRGKRQPNTIHTILGGEKAGRARRVIACVWRINRIKRLSEFGTSLDSASTTGTNRDRLVLKIHDSVGVRFIPAPGRARKISVGERGKLPPPPTQDNGHTKRGSNAEAVFTWVFATLASAVRLRLRLAGRSGEHWIVCP
jgi:hypothetical protein